MGRPSQLSQRRGRNRELRFFTVQPNGLLFLDLCDELQAALHLNRLDFPLSRVKTPETRTLGEPLFAEAA